MKKADERKINQLLTHLAGSANLQSHEKVEPEMLWDLKEGKLSESDREKVFRAMISDKLLYSTWISIIQTSEFSEQVSKKEAESQTESSLKNRSIEFLENFFGMFRPVALASRNAESEFRLGDISVIPDRSVPKQLWPKDIKQLSNNEPAIYDQLVQSYTLKTKTDASIAQLREIIAHWKNYVSTNDADADDWVLIEFVSKQTKNVDCVLLTSVDRCLRFDLKDDNEFTLWGSENISSEIFGKVFLDESDVRPRIISRKS